MGIWIGLAHVRSVRSPDLLEGALGAFVPVVGLSENQENFVSQVFSVLEPMGLYILEIKDIDKWENRISRFPVAEHIQNLVRSLGPDNPVLLSDFHSYEGE